MLASQLWKYCTQYAVGWQQFSGGPSMSTAFQEVGFSEQWSVLGPYQVGTREAIWGADPLEYHGGFRYLEYNNTATYKSSLAFNGSVSWSHVKAQLSPPNAVHASAELSFDFSDIDWRFLQDVYGWAALQWQGWARGEIHVQSQSMKVLALHTEHIMEFWLDGVHYFGGDFYAYGRAPVTLHLDPGVHRIDIRLVRDVRAMGGVGPPSIDVKLILEDSNGLLVPLKPDNGDPYAGVLISDLVGSDFGPLASPYAAITFRNDALQDAYLTGIEATHNQCEAELVAAEPIKFVPGQTRPVAFRLACVPPATGRGPIRLIFSYKIGHDGDEHYAYMATWPLPRGLYEPQKFTYMHPAGMVSYAVLRPPSPNAYCGNDTDAVPVLLQLHGAGLEADSDQVRHALDPLPDLCAWVLFPTGVTPWSGDDWHQWGLADVEAAIAAIPDWMEQVEWQGPGIDVNRWLLSGHSNGGQGVWYALTHRPDKVIAAAPVSGYSSIQNYVPYTFWRTADPGKSAIVNAAMNSYRHELLLENANGISILQQHGSSDDNVPAYHSRLLSQLIEQAGAASTYVEMEGQPHWWDGVMTTEPLRDFFRRHLNAGLRSRNPVNLRDFTVVSSHQGDMGPKNGIEILQLFTPGQLGKIHVTFDPLTLACALRTSNVEQFRLPFLFSECSFIVVDGAELSERSIPESGMTLVLHNSQWLYRTSDVPALAPRQGRQLGGMDTVLRSHGPFYITSQSPAAQRIALQISRNLAQYFAADTYITSHYKEAKASVNANLITVAIGTDLQEGSDRLDHPIHTFSDHIWIRDHDGATRGYGSRDGLAAILLRPAHNGSLELVVWGVDEQSLDIAARLVPMMSGTGVPDFVVADRTMLWKGVEGTLALGWFDGWWNVSANSYFS